MDKTTVFEIIAGSWASVTILMVLGFLNAMRQDIVRMGVEFTKKLDSVENRLTHMDDRIYSLSITKGVDNGSKSGVKKGS